MFRHHIKSESYKFLYQKALLGCALFLLLFIPSMFYVLEGSPSLTGPAFYQSKLLQSFYLGQTGFVVLAALYFGHEFGRSALRTTFLCIPVRLHALFAKVLVLTGITSLLLLLSTLLSFAVLHFVFQVPLSPDLILSFVGILLPAWLSAWELSMLSAALVFCFRSGLSGISILLPLLLGLGQVLIGFGSAFRYLPGSAALNAFFLSENPAYLPLFSGLLWQSIWTGFMFLISVVLFRYRSVK